ncbi:hypothetical protein MHL31_10620 [Lutibacter sp. A80]|uniref:DUF4175 family protein n=1 Tax=Lutibacter sp. A80 TaxID=2918453 RepID=UPI001F070F1D|nr:DUF4175 family protein [Lutibacter sp. A80]UMB59531.1 hypothetical protein MHL31_10620 [Lutibacter sp. A80]
MSNYNYILQKLKEFIRKYYINELIKGILLFFSLGLLYFTFTLVIEHFLWLKPLFRTVLFWLFIVVELALIFKYIAVPIFKIFGLKKGISTIEASKIIGVHFPEIKDKLLNMIQLNEFKHNSELIEASIQQKSNEFKLIPFTKAVNFSSNKKYIKYALLPILIWLLVYVTGNITIFNTSLSRVVHYKTAYQPPAPFQFKVLNTSLDVIEGSDFNLQIQVVGNTIPENATIHFLNQNYYLENIGLGKFQYNFTSVKEPINFYIQATDVISKEYQLNLKATPVITNLKMLINYPSYTGKSNQIIENTGNTIVPQGTTISWQVETHQTDSVSFILNNTTTQSFQQSSTNVFSFSKTLNVTTNYKLATSNSFLKNHEVLNFEIGVITDEYPKIIVKSDIDSITRGPAQFIGQISDDYAVNKLQLVYYDKNNPETLKTHQIGVSKSSFSDFYYVFPEGLAIDAGLNYEMYFEVFDNDRVNGSKKTKSRTFSYYNKTAKELKEDLLKEQADNLDNISKTLEKSKESNSEVNKFKDELKKKSDINWNDSKKLEQFLKRQVQYQEMFKEQTEQLEQNLNEQPEEPSLSEKKEELKKRIDETKKLAEQKDMLKQLEELSKKIDKEDLVDKLEKIAKKNKQNQQSLERILELTKRFYVEQKANQISEKLENLADKEEALSKKNDDENTSEKQDEINKEFTQVKKDIDLLHKQNQNLKRPMKLPNDPDILEDINNKLQQAFDELKEEEISEENTESPNSKSKAKKSQKSAAKKMKQLSKSMEQSMVAMEGESIDENIDDLRKIVENLVEFSFQQEDLLTEFYNTDASHPTYANNLKEQYVLKEYFDHIDDSIYMLSLRMVKMGADIQKDVSDAQYNIDQSLLNFSDNNFNQGTSNQQFVITSVNNLANKLSDLLENLMNASASMGQGKGEGSSKGFSLPDIIKKQGELSKQLEEGMKKGQKPGDSNKGEDGEKKSGEGKGNNGEDGTEQMNQELYEIYKEQAKLKSMLKDMLGNDTKKPGAGAADVVKEMEALEQELLEKGFTNSVLERMKKLTHQLLKLEKARKEQGDDEQRKSKTNIQSFQQRNIDKLKLENLYFNYNEILKRQSLPLRQIYKIKVQEYFKTIQKNDSI